MGVGVTFIDFDTFNVEGLWACYRDKIPEKTDFMIVRKVNIDELFWKEYLVRDGNRMAEY